MLISEVGDEGIQFEVFNMVNEVLCEDADLVEGIEDLAELNFLRFLESQSRLDEEANNSVEYKLLQLARQERRMRVDKEGNARATWLTTQRCAGGQVAVFVGEA